MSDRRVTQTGKDKDGDITKLCHPGSPWSPVSKAMAIKDIEDNTHTYYVPWKSGRTEIHVAEGPTGKYLRTDRDNTKKNNLDELPDC